ncbi:MULTISPECIES: GTPase ObgE [unclassified Microcoleus]|uniref:GTPase ObgE n=1 Tax=unclassified Microcoleus TaxID=2642155 RepID=UPI001DA961D9|nr:MULTISPECIES: GTPase ObgE [unclassified Microcoleus]TAF94699.1 MAG: GTPase ObgE [Oscillatoriales cyanobacterium]MCC3436989.1 GTPase ObgE [Microcoleus sp. PH2017_05_CCC_O_A]MCC3453509.1 GTPase ObgE [Microcoleus sp. PH2017_08_TRC_O_A]MCC3473543.1 GTPase ObgE [Microcoleus sp. PH2017_13_LAR_U_A]MCC3485932.1 GTPase ObgE [Microcoleus sp. PH2017_14_LAR_D_A]
MQFIDRADVQVAAGKGGDGMVAFRREKYIPAGGPSGGTGGRGGSVFMVAVESLQTLLDFQYNRIFKGENGKKGAPKNMTGASGADRTIEVPCGTVVYDAETQAILADLVTPGQTFCVAKGGKGGLGNKCFLTNSNRAPDYALPGKEGEHKFLRLELKLLAEVGIIGLPNAGKSTLISALSAARPKIADYPFTTLIPNLGVVKKPTGDGTVFADIPGLIAGAHEGAGLGYEFLRHIERTRLLLHLVDITDEDPIADYVTIQEELKAYGRGLADRPQILAFNKVDAIDLEDEEIGNAIARLQEISGAPVLMISAVSRVGLDELMHQVWLKLDEMNEVEAEALLAVGVL